ncbi:MAG: DUF1289 domain-containing protein [Gammaproteobacteria bacterium]
MVNEPGSYPQSPCVGVCRIDDDGFCEGCLRTLDEIAAWSQLSAAERARVYERLVERGHPPEVSTPVDFMR